MRNDGAVQIPVKRPANDIERARRAREEAEIERAIAARMTHHERWYAEQKAMLPKALQALARLLDAALYEADNEQRSICRKFLLALCSREEPLFNLSRLRYLEIDRWEDCMAVLGLYQYTACPIHRLIEDGEQVWQRLQEQ